MNKFESNNENAKNKPKISQNESKVNFDLALEKFQKKEYRSAIKIISNMLKVETKNDKFFYLIGRSYFEINEFNQAIVYLTKALEISKKDEYYYWRCKCYSMLDENNQAILDIVKAIELNPRKDTIYRFELNKLKNNISQLTLNSNSNQSISMKRPQKQIKYIYGENYKNSTYENPFDKQEFNSPQENLNSSYFPNKNNSYSRPSNNNNSFLEWCLNLFGININNTPKEKRGFLFYFGWGAVAALLLPTPIFWGLWIYYVLRKDLKNW